MRPLDFDRYRRVVVLTGAGVSAASGLQPFRGPDGLWSDGELVKLAMAATLQAQPHRVLSFLHKMKEVVVRAEPNAAHRALVRLEESLGDRLTLVTQNIDGLHQRAGSRRVWELHGSLLRTRCTDEGCFHGSQKDFFGPEGPVACPDCGEVLRPDVVLFGEYLPPLVDHETKRALRDCDLFIAIGTSGIVWPAAGFVSAVRFHGARTVYVNLESTDNTHFDEQHRGRAEEILGKLLGVD